MTTWPATVRMPDTESESHCALMLASSSSAVDCIEAAVVSRRRLALPPLDVEPMMDAVTAASCCASIWMRAVAACSARVRPRSLLALMSDALAVSVDTMAAPLLCTVLSVTSDGCATCFSAALAAVTKSACGALAATTACVCALMDCSAATGMVVSPSRRRRLPPALLLDAAFVASSDRYIESDSALSVANSAPTLDVCEALVVADDRMLVKVAPVESPAREGGAATVTAAKDSDVAPSASVTATTSCTEPLRPCASCADTTAWPVCWLSCESEPSAATAKNWYCSAAPVLDCQPRACRAKDVLKA